MARSWKKSEINFLKRYAATKTPEELAQRFDAEIDEVVAKLHELGLAPKEGWAQSQGDPALEHYEKALQALYKHKWREAEKLLQQVVEETDQMELGARARQFLEVCRTQTRGGEMEDGDDRYLRAVFLKNQGRLAEALEIAAGGGDDDERYVYLTASIHAVANRLEEAERALLKAVELNPRNRVHAFHDPDFAALRQSEKLAHLFEPP